MRISKISRRSVFCNLFAIALSNTLLQLMGFLYRIFLSRVTGAEGLGVYSLVTPFYSVVTSLTLTGLTVAVARISASRAGIGDMRGARACVSRSRAVFMLAVAPLTALVLMFSRTVSTALLGDSRTARALPFVFACLFLTGLENIYKNYFYAVGKVHPQIVSELSEQLVRAGAVAALLLTFKPTDAGTSAMLIFLGMTISELFSSSLLSLFYRPERKKKTSVRKNSPRVSEILAIAVPVSAAATVNNLLSALNSVLIPRRLAASGLTLRRATESFGIMFGMTMPLLMFPIAFIASLTSVMVPKISEELASGNASSLRRKAGKTIHSTSLLAMPCFAVLIPLGAPLAALLFKNPEAGAFILPLALATLFSYYELTTGALLNGIGCERQAALYIIIGGVLQLAFTWSVGLPHIGMRGYVAGYLVSSLVTAVLNLVCLCRKLSLRVRVGNWFFTPLLASVFACLICGIVYKFLLSRAIALGLCLVLSGTVGIAAYSLALSAMGTNIVRYVKTLIPTSALDK